MFPYRGEFSKNPSDSTQPGPLPAVLKLSTIPSAKQSAVSTAHSHKPHPLSLTAPGCNFPAADRALFFFCFASDIGHPQLPSHTTQAAKSRITIRFRRAGRQAGATKPVCRAGWEWAASCTPAEKSCVDWLYVRRCANKHSSLVF